MYTKRRANNTAKQWLKAFGCARATNSTNRYAAFNNKNLKWMRTKTHLPCAAISCLRRKQSCRQNVLIYFYLPLLGLLLSLLPRRNTQYFYEKVCLSFISLFLANALTTSWQSRKILI